MTLPSRTSGRLLPVLAVLVLAAVRGGHAGETDDSWCVQQLDLEKNKALTLGWWHGETVDGRVRTAVTERVERVYSTAVMGPNYFLQHSLVSVVHFAFWNSSAASEPEIFGWSTELFRLSAFNDLATEELNYTLPGPTYVASTARHPAALGPAGWDALTLGAMDAEDRTNITTIFMPFRPCPGLEQRIYSKAFQMVLMASDMDKDKMSLSPLVEETSARSSLVHLFMSNGLLSLFLTFLLLPFVSVLLHRFLSRGLSGDSLHTADLSLLTTASLVAGSFILYWVFNLVSYYRHSSETVDDVLFPSPFFSPMTQCVIFYMLAGVTSFVGGMLFSRCLSGRGRVTCCQCLGKGLLSSCTTAGFFHAPFFLLALFQDPVTILSYLVSLFTTITLLYLSLFAVIQQYKKSRFQGNFILVVLMQMTLSSVYFVTFTSFRQITASDEPYIADGAYLCIVTLISAGCILLAVAIISMMANGGKKKTVGRRIEKDPENPKSAEKEGPPASGGELQLAGGPGRVADLASLAQKMGFVVLIPDVVQAWQTRPGSDAAATATA
jgi:hypothetical protein